MIHLYRPDDTPASTRWCKYHDYTNMTSWTTGCSHGLENTVRIVINDSLRTNIGDKSFDLKKFLIKFALKPCNIKKSAYLCTRKQEKWCHSSVGRAKDWKSLCPRFDSWWHHTFKRYRNVAQLVAHYVRDVGVGRSSRLIPTKNGKQFSLFPVFVFICFPNVRSQSLAQ